MSLLSFLRLQSRPATGPSAARTRRAVWILAAAALGWGLSPTASAATGTCGAATGQGTNGPADYPTYCWIDFTNYNATQATGAGEAFTITLAGGSTLSFTLTVSSVLNTGGTAVAGGGVKTVAIPTWTGAAFGQQAFTGVPGAPAIYQSTNAETTTVTLSNIVLTVGSGTVPYAIVAADAESTNSGTPVNESLQFTASGTTPWTLLTTMQPAGSTLPTLSGLGTQTVTETGNSSGTVGAYAFSNTGSPSTITAVMVGSGLQGIAFALKFHAVDFAIASVQSGNFAAGGTGTYALTVSSNGPDSYSPNNTVTVTDTLPTGLTYNPTGSGGTGWTCGVAGQVVTCTATNITIASGGSLPGITVNVSVANTIASSVTNTATVASNPNLDFNSANNTATNVTTIVEPDLTNSTKDVVNTSGGYALVGDTLEYTITLTESAGAVAANVSVTDEIPANLSGFTVVSFPGGATNSSTGAGTGTNNDGFLNITGITVPASGSVTVVFTAQVATGTANCTQINNTATITNPNGTVTSILPGAPTVTVNQGACTGGKILYLYDNTGPTYTNLLNRVVQTASTGTGITVNKGTNHVWNMSPTVATGKSLVLPAGNVTVTLIETTSGVNLGTNRPTTVTLLNNGATVATSATVNVANGPTAYTYTIAIPVTTVTTGTALGIQFNNNSGTNNRNILVSQKTAAQGNSMVSFNTSTVINVDSVTAYTANYSATTTVPVFSPGTTVYLCVVISDPFGSYDVDPSTAPQLTLEDPLGGVQVNAQSMGSYSGSPLTFSSGTPNGGGGKDCSGTTNNAVNSYEYSYTLPTAPTNETGNWTASVEAFEGSEGTVNRTASNTFDVEVPSLLVMKSVSVVSDPIEASKFKSIPGAVMLYTITVQNNGKGPVDNGSLLMTDGIPTTTPFYVTSATPYTFTAGTSGLTGVTVTYSNNNGTTYAYTPSTCGGTYPCTDSNITNIKLVFTGSLAGKSGAAPSFTFSFETKVP